MRKWLQTVWLVTSLMQFAACGQTGALVLPGAQPAAQPNVSPGQPDDDDEESSNQ